MHADGTKDADVERALKLFGRNVKRAREARGLNQKDAVDAIGLAGQPAWSKIESGTYRGLSLRHALLIQRVLEVGSLEALFGPGTTGRLMGVGVDEDSS